MLMCIRKCYISFGVSFFLSHYLYRFSLYNPIEVYKRPAFLSRFRQFIGLIRLFSQRLLFHHHNNYTILFKGFGHGSRIERLPLNKAEVLIYDVQITTHLKRIHYLILLIPSNNGRILALRKGSA